MGDDVDSRIQKIFRISKAENESLDDLVRLAYMIGLIKDPSFQAFMQFALNCAHEWVKTEYLHQRGIKMPSGAQG